MKKIGVLFFILIIFSFHMAVSYQILSKSKLIHFCDEHGRICEGWSWYQHINNHGFINSITFKFRLSDGTCHPPFQIFTQALSWLFLSKFKLTFIPLNLMIILTNSFYFFILLMSVYGIGKLLYSTTVGILSAFLISMFPVVFGHSRIVMLDYPLTSMTALTIYMLLRTKNFSLTLYSVLAGLVFGIAQLTKEVAIVFVLPPLIYYFYESLRLRNKVKVSRNFFYFLLFFMIISGIVYLRAGNLDKFWWLVYPAQQISNAVSSHFSRFSIFHVFIGLHVFIGPYLLYLCLPLVLSYLININRRNKILLFWLVIPFILFNISSRQIIRYILPLSVPFCLISVQELFNNALFKKIKTLYIPVLIAVAVIQYILINYGLLLRDDDIRAQFERGIFCVYKDKHYEAGNFLFEIFKQEAKQNRLDIIAVSDFEEIDDYVELNLTLNSIPCSIECPSHFVSDMYKGIRYQKSLERAYRIINKIPTTNYILESSKSVVVPSKKFIENSGRYKFTEYKDKFKIIAKVILPDASYICVYKRIR